MMAEISVKETKENKEVIDENKILCNFKLLSKLDVGQKLMIENDELKVDDRYTIFRMFSTDNRYTVIQFLENLIKTCSLVKNKFYLKADMTMSLVGLRKLQITYLDDSFVCSKLDNIMRNIQSMVDKI